MKWIGANTQYITDNIATVTDSAGKLTTTTAKPIGVLVVGSVDPSGTPIGDFGVILAPAFLDEVEKIAAASCEGAKRASE
jgi:hypothetical protein